MKQKMLIDFETKSDLPIDVGMVRYMHTNSSDIICMSWKMEDKDTRLWIPGMPQPFNPSDYIIYAHNIQFDWRAWNVLGVDKYKYFTQRMDITGCVDTMALAGRYTYPQSLDWLGTVLDTDTKKSKRGHQLMKKICSPPFKYTRDELIEFYHYCITDTDTMYDILNALPADRLSDTEQRYWLDTVRINQAGLPIDMRSARRINETIQHYKKQQMRRVPALTDDRIQTVGQIKEIRLWAAEEHDVHLPNLQVGTVEEKLLDPKLPPPVRAILNLRVDLARSSLAKYNKILQQSYKSHVHINLRYYGAATGRFAGLGFQIHNLPRAKVDEPEAAIQSFKDTSIILEGDIMGTAKALIRPMIKAPEGKKICVADWSAIENRNLMWLCNERQALDLLHQGKCQYRDFASVLWRIPYDEVSEEQRFFGKTNILGDGYGLGWKGYKGYAKSFGLSVSDSDAKKSISTYRAKYHNVPKFWRNVKERALDAVENKGLTFTLPCGKDLCSKIDFKTAKDRNGRYWLTITLPSGRNIFYCDPMVGSDSYGAVVTHMGINSYTNQWTRLKLIPGRITENIDQGMARDILCVAVSRLIDKGWDVRGHVHDEIIALVDNGGDDANQRTLASMIDTMCTVPDWCQGLPLNAEGYVEDRYRKG